jgi:PAS domain S-box-containing protein
MKLQEQALTESEERFRTAFEFSASGMCLTGLDGMLLRVNRKLCDMLGYTKKELEEKHFNSVTHPEDQKIGSEVVRKMVAGKIPSAAFEKRYLKKTGETIWVHINTALIKDAFGKPLHFIAQIEDITERKKIEEKLKEREQLLSETGRIALIGGWEFDPLTLKGTWTDEVARIHDLDPEQETNTEYGLSFYHGEHRKKMEQAVGEAIESGKPYDLEVELVTAKGVHKWVRAIGQPI